MSKRTARLLLALAIIIILAIISSYIFIPSTLPISKITYIQATQSGAIRTISNTNKWKDWASNNNGFTFHPDKTLIDITGVIIRSPDDSIYSTIAVLPLKVDSIAIQWKCILQTGNNPITRIQQYIKAHQIKSNMADLSSHLKSYLEKQENIYGFKVEQTKVTDTVLLATSTTTTSYPKPAEIYSLVQKLRNHASSHGAKEMNYPMLNVKQLDSSLFQTMVALSISHTIPETNNISIRRMVPGNILIAEVKGGPNTIEEAFKQMDYYIHDYRRIPPAKPFQSLVTDRSKESDTTKWVTRIYYPVL